MLKKYIFALFAALLCIFSLSACTSYSPPEPALSQKEVDALREEYPVYPVKVHQLVSMDTDISVEEMAANPYMDTAIYGTITSNKKWKYVSLAGADHPELEEKKRELTGMNSMAGFLFYEMEVIRDAGGKYQPGDKVLLSITEFLEPTIPEFKPGDKFITLACYYLDDKHDFHFNKNNYSENELGMAFKGLYYVTEDGYAISTSGEEPQTRASGMTADDCVDYLYYLTQQKDDSSSE